MKPAEDIYKLKPDEEILKINRHEGSQIEINSANDTVIYMVKWTSPCEYELHSTFKMKELSDSTQMKVVGEDIRQLPLNVKIIATNNDFYVFESRKKGINVVYKDTMWVAK